MSVFLNGALAAQHEEGYTGFSGEGATRASQMRVRCIYAAAPSASVCQMIYKHGFGCAVWLHNVSGGPLILGGGDNVLAIHVDGTTYTYELWS